MICDIQGDILKLHSLGLLDRLLADKTTRRRIMWATDAYAALGSRFGRNEEITPILISFYALRRAPFSMGPRGFA